MFAELPALPFDVADEPVFAEPPAVADALALVSECEEPSDFVPDVALASLLLALLDVLLALLEEPDALLEELDALLEELDELVELPPPVAVSEVPPEPAAF